MYDELQALNHWLNSKDAGFLRKHGIDRTYFFSLKSIADWIEDFHSKSGKLPSAETASVEFEDFRKVEELEPVDYVVNKLLECKAYSEYRPLLKKNAEMIAGGKTIEAMWDMKNHVETMIKNYTSKMTRYDWVKDAKARFESYMETHGQEGLAGLTTGFKGLDDLTGGWRADDLILIMARLNEGKSLLGTFFSYMVWRSLQSAGINDPVIFITTEMPKEEVAYRLDTMRAHFSNNELGQGKLKDTDLYREYLEELEKKDTSFLILDQDSNGGKPFTPSDIRSIIETEKPVFICIDQLYDISDGTGEKDIRKRIVNVSNQIREVNLNTLTPIMLITQAGRESAKSMKKDSNATPELHEVQESDNPGQKATRVLALRMLDDNMFKITLKKNRSGKKNTDIFAEVDIDKGIWNEVSQEESVF